MQGTTAGDCSEVQPLSLLPTEKENKPWVSWSARRRSRSLARHRHRPDLLDRRQGPKSVPPLPSPPPPTT